MFLLIKVIALLLWKFYAFWKLPDFYFSGMVIFNFDQIIFGVLLSPLYLKFENQLKLIRNYFLILGVLLFLSGNLILVKYILTANPSQGAELWMHVVFILSFGLLVLFSADYYANKNMFTNLMKIISEASYSIYLSHMLILFLLVDKVLLKIPLLTNSSSGRLSIFFAFLIATVAISYFVYLKFELPVLAFRDKFTSRKELVSKN